MTVGLGPQAASDAVSQAAKARAMTARRARPVALVFPPDAMPGH